MIHLVQVLITSLFVGSNDGSFYMLDAAKGTSIDVYVTEGMVHSSPTVNTRRKGKGGSTVYVGSDDGSLYSFNAAC